MAKTAATKGSGLGTGVLSGVPGETAGHQPFSKNNGQRGSAKGVR